MSPLLSYTALTAVRHPLMARRDNSGTVRCVTEIISAVAPTKRWFRRGRPRTTHLTEGTPAIGIAPDDATDPVGEFCALWAARLHEMHTSWGSQGVVLTVLTVSRTDATPDQLAALALLLPDLLDRKSLCDAVNLLLGAKHADARVVRPLTIEEFSSVLRTSRPAELESPVDSLDRAFGLGFADLFSRVVISHNKSYTLDELLEALAGTEHAIPLVLRGWNNDAMTLPAVFEKVRALPRTGAEVASHLVLSGSDESFDDLCLLAESLLQDAGTPESLQTV